MRYFYYCALVLMCSQSAFSQSVNNLPIDLSADSGSFDQTAGIAIYTGNVIVKQGGSTIWADRLTVTLKDNTAKDLDAQSTSQRLVRFVYEGEEQPMSGQGKKIHYNVPSKMVTITGDAQVTQGDDVITGETLQYDLANEVITGSRVKMTLLPRDSE